MKRTTILLAVLVVLGSFVFFYSNSDAKNATIGNIQPSSTGVACSNLTFSSNSVLGASKYDFVVDDNADFSSPLMTRTDLPSPSFTQGSQVGDPSQLAANTWHYIRVIAKDGSGVELDRGTEDFKTDVTCP